MPKLERRLVPVILRGDDSVKEQLLKALDLDEQGDWDGAHRVVQSIEDTHAYWIHAYLHRVEGDLGNAAYWYNRAGQPVDKGDLDAERAHLREIVEGLG